MNAFRIVLAGMLLFVGICGGTTQAMGIPPAPEDPLLANVAPDECLFYTTWAGTAVPDPDSLNQTEQLLAEPEIRALVAEVERLVAVAMHQAGQQGEAEQAGLVEDASRWGQMLVSSPAAAFVSSVAVGPEGPDVRGGVLVRIGKENGAALSKTLEKYRKLLPAEAVETVQIGGIDWHRVTIAPEAPTITVGVRGNYFIVSVGEGSVEGILDRATTPVPDWLAEIRQQLPVERPTAVSYINVKKVLEIAVPLAGDPELPKILEGLGVANVASLAWVSGLDGEGMVDRVLVSLDGSPRGLLGLAAAKPLGPAELTPIPADSTLAAAVRLDASQLFDLLMTLAGQVDPGAQQELIQGLTAIREQLGVDVQGDVLASLGDAWRFYNSPGEGGLVLTGLTAVVSVKDRQRLADAQAKLLAAFQSEMERREGVVPRIEEFEFAGQRVHFFNARDEEFPLAPAWCLTEKELIVGTFPQNIKAYLSRGADYQSLATVPAVAAALAEGDGPMKLAYIDVRPLFEMVYPMIPMVIQSATSQMAKEGIDVNVSIVPSAAAISKHLRPEVMFVRRTEAGIEWTSRYAVPGGSIGSTAPVAVALLMPAVQAAREASRRAQSMNNLKQIAISMHNYHDAHKRFPPAYVADANGKPLLSWRVLILPYIDQKALYDQFHLDEPWDSEHNKTLIPLMPAIYAAPCSTAGPQKTNYLTIRGEHTVFSGATGSPIAAITDGTSYTIMAVEANDLQAVVWTKPDDFAYDERNPAAGLTGLRPRGFNAAMCDGSVRFITGDIDAETLRNLMLRDDRNPVDLNRLEQ